MTTETPIALSLFGDDPPTAPAVVPAAAPPAPATDPRNGSSGALYRRYRSRDFHELVGQEPIVHTLQNALASGRLAHAYLFCGPRGTGKTSTARLLAKAVNCLAPAGTERPCNVCEVCRSINEARAMDLIEIDAASNNSVEDVRDLRERVNFAPAVFRRKFYIIDEVHMMSQSAFNALLKTLEEPPAHTIFVLATTDPQKLPATVLSRCQRFDFRRIALPVMVRHMAGICATEGYAVEPGVLELIGRQATGCMRDALSLLDQLMSFADGTLLLSQVQAVLGARGAAEIGAFVDRLITGDVAGGLHDLHAAMEGGADPRQFNRQVVEYLRSLLLLRAGGAGSALDATEEEVAALRAQAERTHLPALSAWIRAFSAADNGLKGGLYAALPLELALVEASLVGTVPAAPSAHTLPAAPAPPSAARPEAARPTPVPTRPSEATRPAASSMRPAEPPPVQPANPQSATHKGNPTGFRNPQSEPSETVTNPQSTIRNPQSDAPADMGQVLTGWAGVGDGLRKRSELRLQAFLRAGVPVRLEGDVVIIGFPASHGIHREAFEQPKNRALVESVMAEVFSHPYRLRCIPMSDEDLSRAGAARPAAPPAAPSAAPARAQKARAILDED